MAWIILSVANEDPMKWDPAQAVLQKQLLPSSEDPGRDQGWSEWPDLYLVRLLEGRSAPDEVGKSCAATLGGPPPKAKS